MDNLYIWNAYLPQISCYLWLKSDNVRFDIELWAKVKFDTTNYEFSTKYLNGKGLIINKGPIIFIDSKSKCLWGKNPPEG